VRFTSSEKSHHERAHCIRTFCDPSTRGDAIRSAFRSIARGGALAVLAARTAMTELMGDRFLVASAQPGCAIDLATGVRVRLRIAAAGDRAAQIAWNDRCAGLARLRHPLLNPLVDFGFSDRRHTFEAYAVSSPIRSAGRRGPSMLSHLVRFLQARGIHLSQSRARLAVRELATATSGSRRRPLAVIVQPRSALAALEEALDDATHGGTAQIDVVGASGSGLRTLHALTARAARLRGYIPISTQVLLRLPEIRTLAEERHVCLFIEEHDSAEERRGIALFLAELGTASARRHVAVRFSRELKDGRPALTMDRMDVTTLTSMVFCDAECGPNADELSSAAREAGGMPGIFLDRLRGAPLDAVAPLSRRSASREGGRLAMVRESSAAYRTERVPCPPGGKRAIGRALADAPDRAERLADRGRHASAGRLLSRAIRVLEARGEVSLAASCAARLAWIDRQRGRSDRALEGFERARRLAGDGVHGVAAVIGIGTIWIDEQRLTEAEAALRGACAAASVLRDPDLEARAQYALARCFFWQTRYDEASVLLAAIAESNSACRSQVEARALAARIRAAEGDLQAAVAAANDAIALADRFDGDRWRAVAARAMTIVQAALGDHDRLRHWAERGRQLAASAHLPILGLRLRAIVVRDCRSAEDGRLRGHLRAALRHRPLSRLARQEIEAACDGRTVNALTRDSAHERSLRELQQLLEIAQGADDDDAALAGLCDTLCERLRAASVQIVGGANEPANAPRTLARAGRPWQGDARIVERILAGGSGVSALACAEPRQAAEPVCYGRQPIAVMCCRWTPGTAIDPERSATLLRAGALAAAAPVRSVLDRAAPHAIEVAGGELVGTSPAALALREAIARAARAPFPVLIEGESGSGKELVARGIHRLSTRRDRRLCTVNCAALSDDLLEAELFGHARGAFTGAVGERAGLFEEADGGTLFLDEIGELSPRAQAKLLRVLQDGEVRRVGENLPRRVDARVVAATNRRLADEAAAGRFRADLRFRLDVVRIDVPPLRDRAADVPALALHFWADAAGRVGSAATLTPETLAALARYDWPGNVRELQNAIASLAVHAPRRGRILPSMLPRHVAGPSAATADTFEAARNEFERRFVRAALAQAGGQRARAARALGVSRQGLAKMLRRLQILDDRGAIERR
jgi:DNA-binding NtrC family response regulator/tetratricopeptide (TPR) repeat protein